MANNFSMSSPGDYFYDKEPTRTTTQYIELTKCREDVYIFIKNLATDYPDKNIVVSIEHDRRRYEDDPCDVYLVISEVIIKDNPDYEWQLKKYETKLAAHNKVLSKREEWKINATKIKKEQKEYLEEQ